MDKSEDLQWNIQNVWNIQNTEKEDKKQNRG